VRRREREKRKKEKERKGKKRKREREKRVKWGLKFGIAPLSRIYPQVPTSAIAFDSARR
jgi:hypothetical protein